MRYDYIKTLIQENLQETDEDEQEGIKKENINEKKCMKIIERIKFIFDFLKKNYDKSVNNLAVNIDNFFHKSGRFTLNLMCKCNHSSHTKYKKINVGIKKFFFKKNVGIKSVVYY